MKTSSIIILSLIGIGVITCLSFIYSVEKEFYIKEETTIEGSNNLVQKKIEVGDFHSVISKDQINVIIAQGEQDVEISAEDNLIDLIEVDVKNNELHIYKRYKEEGSIQINQPLIVKVSNPIYNKLSAYNQSNISIRGKIESKELEINLRQQSGLDGEINAERLFVNSEQQTSFNLRGTAIEAEIVLNNNAVMDCGDLIIENLNIHMDDNTRGSVNVTQEISGNASENSDLKIKGNPPVNKLRVSGNADLN